MKKKSFIYGIVSLVFCILVIFIVNRVNLNSSDNTNISSKVNDKIKIYYEPNVENLEMLIYDYKLDDEDISEQIDLAVKQLPNASDDLFGFVEDIKKKVKHENIFEYDDTGTYEICMDKKVGQYKVTAEVEDEEYLGRPQVFIKIFK